MAGIWIPAEVWGGYIMQASTYLIYCFISKESHRKQSVKSARRNTDLCSPPSWRALCLIDCISCPAKDKNRRLKFTFNSGPLEYTPAKSYCAAGQYAYRIWCIHGINRITVSPEVFTALLRCYSLYCVVGHTGKAVHSQQQATVHIIRHMKLHERVNYPKIQLAPFLCAVHYVSDGGCCSPLFMIIIKMWVNSGFGINED